MSLTDLMSHSGLSWYAIVALVLFFAAFLAIVIWVFRPKRRTEFEEAGRIPFEDDIHGGARR